MLNFLRTITTLAGLGLLVMGLLWWIQPAIAAEILGASLLEGTGLSTQIGDSGAFFVGSGLLLAWGALRNRARLRSAPQASSNPEPTKKAPESPIWVLSPVPSSKLAPNISAAMAGWIHQSKPITKSPSPARVVIVRKKFSMATSSCVSRSHLVPPNYHYCCAILSKNAS